MKLGFTSKMGVLLSKKTRKTHLKLLGFDTYPIRFALLAIHWNIIPSTKEIMLQLVKEPKVLEYTSASYVYTLGVQLYSYTDIYQCNDCSIYRLNILLGVTYVI